MTVLQFLERVIVPTLVIFFLLGGAAGTAFGLSLALRPAGAIAFMRSMNRWVSTRRALRPAEMPRSISVATRRGRIGLALFLVFGGLFALWFLVLRLEIPRAAAILGVDIKRWALTSIALQTTKWFMVAGSVLAVVVGALILFFPGRLASLEERMNRWYSTRNILPPSGETMRFPLDRLVEASPVASGWLIAAASLVLAAAMAVLLAARIAA